MTSKHINPIIPGFSPDPSITWIKDRFYLVTSTFHMFPGLPIYSSTDLISWTHVGNVIHRQSQLSLAKSSTRNELLDDKTILSMTGGLYAPTIRHHDGVTYVVCTNVLHSAGSKEFVSENFFVSTTNILSNEWSDPVYFEFHGIDPSLFFDDDGRAYMKGSAAPGPFTKIKMFEIDIRTGAKLTEEREIWGGTGGIHPEGPHLYKKDSWYYVCISEGGTHEGHMITMARSRDLWGPYQAFEHNPVLTACGTDEYVQYTGHGDLFQDQEGRWWCVCLGSRFNGDRNIMGRETFLTAVEWPVGGWPNLKQLTIDLVLSDGTSIERPEGNISVIAEPLVALLYIRDMDPQKYEISDVGKKVILSASTLGISENSGPVTFIGKRQRKLDGEAGVTMVLNRTPIATDADLQAGMAYYKDEHRFIKLFYDSATDTMVIQFVNTVKAISRITSQAVNLGVAAVFLRIRYVASQLNFEYSEGVSGEWKGFEPVDTLDMTGKDFVGPVIGIFATANEEGIKVDFDGLSVD